MTLSGWGQPHDALASIARGAHHVEYAKARSVPEALALIAEAGKEHDLAVGWSLGGQLLVRSIAEGLIRPRALVLIGTSFQFVENKNLTLGMKRDAYEKFRDNYKRNPERTLNKAWELVVLDDRRDAHIRAAMEKHDKAGVLAHDWHRWLEQLDGFSCAGLPFDDFPPTLLVHGRKDAVVGAEQSAHFAGVLPDAKLVMWESCGHAPHWHNAEKMKQLIEEHFHV